MAKGIKIKDENGQFQDAFILNQINDTSKSDLTTYSSNKIDSMLSVLNNTLSLQVVSTEEEFEDFIQNMNTHTLYLINNTLIELEEYQDDAYVEVIAIDVGNEEYMIEFLGTTSFTEQMLDNYYTKQQINDYGIMEFIKNFYLNNKKVDKDYYNIYIRDINGNSFTTERVSSSKAVEIILPISPNQSYQTEKNIQNFSSDNYTIDLINNKEIRIYSEMEKIGFVLNTIKISDFEKKDFNCSVLFNTKNKIRLLGENEEWLSYTGDDCINGKFNIKNNCTYKINFVISSSTTITGIVNRLKWNKIQYFTEEDTIIALENDKEYRCGAVSTLTLTLPDSYPEDFNCSLVFDSVNPTTLTTPTLITFVGDDCLDGVLIPQANTSYEIDIKYLGNDRIIARVGAF